MLRNHYRACDLCPHRCGVDRTSGGRGICGSGTQCIVASANIHRGEEPPISGIRGSGTIFFSRCTGSCIFCQNYPISQLGTGNPVTDESLGEMMLDLQAKGCHNINIVTPTHFAPSVAAGIRHAAACGLSIPLVYNTSGYERVEVIRELEGIVDIYLPDAKYADDDVARSVSGFRGYVAHNRAAIAEMHRQVGNLKMHRGIAWRGMLVRHMILPENMSGTPEVMRFLAGVSPDLPVSVMDQYFPAYRAFEHSVLSRRITPAEYEAAIEAFHNAGLRNGFIQTREELQP